MTALIDADSIVYIVAWHHKEEEDTISGVYSVKAASDQLVQSILDYSKASTYIGSFSDSTNFRYRHYLFAPYKGNRRKKDEWVCKWEPYIKDHLADKWGFVTCPDLEADDVISGLWHLMQPNDNLVICSPDKDLLQIPGLHYDYKKNTGIVHIEEQVAQLKLCHQMLTGDRTDNIKGIPAIGEVKASALVPHHYSIEEMKTAVCHCYYKYFGEYYGPIIYEQTKIALQTLCLS